MKLVKLLLFSFVGCFACGASAQNYPSKPIKLVVPYAAGGGSDFVARLIGLKLTEFLEQSIIIDNRPGAGGLIGAELVARAPAAIPFCSQMPRSPLVQSSTKSLATVPLKILHQLHWLQIRPMCLLHPQPNQQTPF